MADKTDLRHVVSDAPRVMVVDGSKLVRKLISDTLLKEMPNAQVVGCGGLAEARAALAEGAHRRARRGAAGAGALEACRPAERDRHVQGPVGRQRRQAQGHRRGLREVLRLIIIAGAAEP